MTRFPTASGSITLVWLRQDLRVSDHPALTWALENSRYVVPLFIWSPLDEGAWPVGAATRWWLHYSLEALAQDLSLLGLPLVVRQGSAVAVLKGLCREIEATHVVWSRRYEPSARRLEEEVATALTAVGVNCAHYNSALLHEPWTVSNKKGAPFKVYTPFWKTCCKDGAPAKPLPVPKPRPEAALGQLSSLAVSELSLLPKIHWDAGLKQMWQPGSAAANKLLEQFHKQALAHYEQRRNFPDMPGVSRMSPYLHWGEVSPRQIWWALNDVEAVGAAGTYLSQLGWREFAYHLLYHYPETAEQPLRAKFAAFPWHDDAIALQAWQKGITGYPIVDAGMRQLWHTGWMHNRVRMIVGSFLVKHLLISWQEGARWFWDTLVDADLANNTLGWQWVSGCGADAAPYFRIFNPVLQGEKFDATGGYVRRWVPELAKLPDRWLHKPWQASAEVLRAAGLCLGEDYPFPIVDHQTSRLRALSALRQSKR